MNPHPLARRRQPKLATLGDVRAEMARVYRAMANGLLDPADGTKFVFALVSLAKVIEVESLERRVTELERTRTGA